MIRDSNLVRGAFVFSALILAAAVRPAAAATAISWVNPVNASASGSALQKTKGCSGCYDAGALSQQSISTGTVYFSVNTGQFVFVGLGYGLSSTSYYINYAFKFTGGTTWEIREGNVYKTEGSYASTDVFSISTNGSSVTYYRNGSPVYTSETPVPGALTLGASISNVGGGVTTASYSGTATTATPSSTTPSTTTPSDSGTAVSWINPVNVTPSGSTLKKTSGCSGCFDAGAISQQSITNGTLSFTVATGQMLYVGLGADTSNSTSYNISFAFKFTGGSGWEIREANVYRTEGAYATGDTFSIGVNSGKVTYYQNGAAVYTSPSTASGALVADTSFATVGNSVSTVTLSGSTTPTATTTPTTTTTTTPTTTTPTTSTSSGSTTLRVLQWNTHHGGYGTDGVYSPDRVATWAASFKPDVVMFNEIERNDSWGNQDQPEVYKALLQAKTGRTWYYVFAQEFGAWSSSGKGNLILSTYPIAVLDRYELVHNGDRSIAMAQITVNSRDITLMLTHLDPYDATLRLTQATEVTGWAAVQPENRIITGDMNAWPDQASIAQYDSLYYDSWAVAANQGTATAFPGNNGETKSGRIDYIFYSKGSASLSVVSSQVYDTRDASGFMPSDHRPVLTTFSVK